MDLGQSQTPRAEVDLSLGQDRLQSYVPSQGHPVLVKRQRRDRDDDDRELDL